MEPSAHETKNPIALSLATALELRRIGNSLKATVDLILESDDEDRRAIALIFHPGVQALLRILDEIGLPGGQTP